ncbi:MAG: virulence RhuM family protein [Aquamicrobium sp.]|nr:virulence RhuM family protein [Aquamicrobium sp.]
MAHTVSCFKTAADGNSYRTTHSNLDAILAVGCRANSKKALAFRKRALVS